MKYFDRVWVSTATTGTGTVTLGSALSGYQTFANGGVSDGDTVRYTILDGTAWEVGTGVYTSSGTTMSRSLNSSSTGSLISLSGNASLFLTYSKRDAITVMSVNDQTTAESFVLPSSTNGFSVGPITVASGHTVTVPTGSRWVVI